VASKVHRNDPCFCGSGKKYKKCCMLEARELSAVRAANREAVQDAVNWITGQHGDALTKWVQGKWFKGMSEDERKGLATADPSIKHVHDTNLLEYLIAEGFFEDDGDAQPVLQLILDAALDLTDAQREYLQQLGTRPLLLYRVSQCAAGERFSLQACGETKNYGETKTEIITIEDRWMSRMLDPGDVVGLRLMQTGGIWETSGAVYHIPDDYVASLSAELETVDAADYSRTLIHYWLGLVAAHI